MIPLQDIKIKSKNGSLFSVVIEKHSNSLFRCRFAVVENSELCGEETLECFREKQRTAQDVFEAFIQDKVSKWLVQKNDSIIEIDNPCNTELLSPEDQQRIVGDNVVIKINGK